MAETTVSIPAPDPGSGDAPNKDKSPSPEFSGYVVSVPQSRCRIFGKALAVVFGISFASSLHIGSQYLPIVFMQQGAKGGVHEDYYTECDMKCGSWLALFAALFAIGVLWILNVSFIELYTSFLFKMDSRSRIGDLGQPVCCCSYVGWICSCCTYFILIILWAVYFVINLNEAVDDDTDGTYDEVDEVVSEYFWDLTSINSPLYWAIGLLLSPTLILFVVISLITWYLHRSQREVGRAKKEPLLVDDEANQYETEWEENQRYLHRVLFLHFVLLSTWVFWKWITTPFLSIHDEVEDGTPHFGVSSARNNGYLSYWTLYIFTTLVKVICLKLADIPKDNTMFSGYRLKRMIGILVEILFAFGLKFVFTNLEEWTPFIAISAMNCVLSIFVSSMLNQIKGAINKVLGACAISKRIAIPDLSDSEKVKEYNKELGLDQSLKFVIGSSSCLICMVYFGMNIAIGSSVNDLVFAFMAVSFGFECVVFMGQIVVFDGEHRNYLIGFLEDSFEDRTSWDTDDERKENWMKSVREGKVKFESEEKKRHAIDNWKPARQDWCMFVCLCLCLAWCWAGSLTGLPADVQLS